jgi:3-hydroxybutyryl-CoA dehydrogenase
MMLICDRSCSRKHGRQKAVFLPSLTACARRTLLLPRTLFTIHYRITSATQRKEKVLGRHFFNPVPTMKLVELVKGMETSEETINKAREFTKRSARTKW